MHNKVDEIMSQDLKTATCEQTAQEAAEIMSANDIGSVVVTKADGGEIDGIVTDRDIAVRAIAKGKDPASCKLSDIASTNLRTLHPGDSIDLAVDRMRSSGIRRLPVVQDGKAVGIVALGDLATDRDPTSALGRISRAPANH